MCACVSWRVRDRVLVWLLAWLFARSLSRVLVYLLSHSLAASFASLLSGVPDRSLVGLLPCMRARVCVSTQVAILSACIFPAISPRFMRLPRSEAVDRSATGFVGFQNIRVKKRGFGSDCERIRSRDFGRTWARHNRWKMVTRKATGKLNTMLKF